MQKCTRSRVSIPCNCGFLNIKLVYYCVDVINVCQAEPNEEPEHEVVFSHLL